ncbi:MAG TPA: bacillithiol transferase BstA [Acidobacteriaceae bacterium]|nr:bacillithiol transferase BstA [Acidobacteriaceae bacterium]
MTTETATQDVRYPIGKFERPSYLSVEQRAAGIQAIADFPRKLRDAVDGLYESQLDTSYRDGGWTVRQTIHHLADSHMQATGRIRLALTEEWPKITPYQEKLWAELPDVLTEPLEPSLQLLEGLHQRWTPLLRSLPEPAWVDCGYIHAELGQQTLEQVVALYAWHGRHHTAHITALRERMGW